jgi:hypothetical protein
MWQFYKRNLGATNWRRLQCEFLSLVSSRAQAARDYVVVVVVNNNNNYNNADKELKYQSLCTEIQRMWNLKCRIIPIVIEATGIVMRSLRKNLEAVPGKHSIDSLQRQLYLGTAHIIRKVLQCEA